MRIRILSVSVLVLCLGVCSVPANATSIFNFESLTLGTSTTFTYTVGGLSATFSSPSDPGGFTVAPTFFSTLTGQILFDPGPAFVDNIPLTIVFSSALSNISLLFATNSGSGVPLVLNAFNGATFVGSASASGAIPSGFGFPEGSLTFTGGPFDRIVLSSAALDFAIDDISATPIATPEPGSLLTVGLGLVFLGVAARRKRARLPASRIVA